MKTEELNEYIFADLVNKAAFELYSRHIQKLEYQGFSFEEAAKQAPTKDSFTQAALANLKDAKKRVFAALSESEKEA